jgi:hypothetical protein
MNGTVKIGPHTVTRAGKTTKITSSGSLTRAEFNRLRDQANAMLAAGTANPAPASPAVVEKAAEALAQVRSRYPAPSTIQWQDAAQADPWGAPLHGHQVLNRKWVGGNCVRACIASILNAPIGKVPDPTVEYNEGVRGWFERYDARLQKRTGYRLERLPKSCCPPRNTNQLWIAGIHMPDDPDDHVVVARNFYVVHDPLGELVGNLPWDRIIDGMLVVPARRVVPVFSPHVSGRTIVAA